MDAKAEQAIVCGFCGEKKPAGQTVEGGKGSICMACVAKALESTMASRTAALAPELPNADAACSFCGKKAPRSSLFTARRKKLCICTACLAQSYWFLAAEADLEDRQETWQFLADRTARTLAEKQFAGIGIENVVTASRVFPEYMRVDLNKCLETALSGPGVQCVGLRREYSHETLRYAALLDSHSPVQIAPLQYDEIDIGESTPARCLNEAMWLVPHSEAAHIVLLSQQQQFGQSRGWFVEVAVPPGEAGDAIVRSYFATLETALQTSASYRGKVLSLEQPPRMMGTAATISVQRLAPVAREDVILPPKTLELLERNVFRFAAHRAELHEMGLPVKKGLLFYGPPGTGKTHTIRYLTGALPGHTTLLVTAEQVGILGDYITLARLLSPSILVIEDADLIGRDRERMGGPCEEAMLNKLLNEMDGLRDNAELLFILTTNRPEAMEMALTSRPGRIDQAIEFPLPDADGRRKLARLYGKGARVSEATLDQIVEKTDRVSAAFIKELMRRSAQFALERGKGAEITPADLDAALDELLFAGGRLNAALLGALGGRPDGTE